MTRDEIDQKHERLQGHLLQLLQTGVINRNEYDLALIELQTWAQQKLDELTEIAKVSFEIIVGADRTVGIYVDGTCRYEVKLGPNADLRVAGAVSLHSESVHSLN